MAIPPSHLFLMTEEKCLLLRINFCAQGLWSSCYPENTAAGPSASSLKWSSRGLYWQPWCPLVQQLQKWRDQLLLALTVLLPALDQADCSGFCGRAMLRNKWLENTLGQRVDWFVHFKLKHILEKSKTDFFFLRPLFLFLQERWSCIRRLYYKIRIHISEL